MKLTRKLRLIAVHTDPENSPDTAVILTPPDEIGGEGRHRNVIIVLRGKEAKDFEDDLDLHGKKNLEFTMTIETSIATDN